MAAVVVENSHTPHCSDTAPQIPSSPKPGMPGAQHQNPITDLTLEEKVDRILLKARLPVTENHVLGMADVLEKVSRAHFLLDRCNLNV
jgi:hypothetical protein